MIPSWLFSWETLGSLIVLGIIGALIKFGNKFADKSASDIYDWLKGQFFESSNTELIENLESPFNIPHASLGDKFVGRQGDLEAIREELSQGSALAVGASGIGGAGKTRFAAEYAHQYREDYPGGCLWVPSESGEDGSSSVTSSLALLNVPLGLNLPPDMPDVDQAERVVDFLSKEEQRTLLIFDNADEWSEIRDPIHRLSRHHILVTTRNPNLSGDLQTRNLDVLKRAPALDLLLSCCGGDRPRPGEGSEEYEGAARIAARLGRLPLALEIAAAYLKTWSDITFASYDVRLVNESLTNTIDDAPDEFVNTRHEASVHATFHPAWEKLEETPDARKLLSRAAFFAPESICSDLLAKAAELSTDVEPGHHTPYDLTLRVVENAGLLERSTDRRITCHRLVADFVRETLSEDERKDAVQSVTFSLSDLVDREIKDLVMELGKVAAEKPHLDGILEWLDKSGEEEAWGSLAYNVARYLELRAEYGEAEPLYQRALTITERALGPDHPSVGTRLNNLAGLYRYQGRYAEAEPLSQRDLEITERALGAEHPDMGTSLNNLAGIYRSQGRYAEAEPLYERALAIFEKALGENHPDVGATLNNLAELYRSQGRGAEAEPLYQRDLAITERALGPGHPSVGTSLNNLAVLYESQGRYADAEPLYQRSLAIFEKALGDEHPSVGVRLNNLALLYESQGRYTEAEPLYERALVITEGALGPEHRSVGIRLNNLANLYRSQGRYAEAEPLYERALSIFEKALGEDHPDFLTVLNNFAIFCDKVGKTDRASELLERIRLIGSGK